MGVCKCKKEMNKDVQVLMNEGEEEIIFQEKQFLVTVYKYEIKSEITLYNFVCLHPAGYLGERRLSFHNQALGHSCLFVSKVSEIHFKGNETVTFCCSRDAKHCPLWTLNRRQQEPAE